jgi:hypothetical protein
MIINFTFLQTQEFATPSIRTLGKLNNLTKGDLCVLSRRRLLVSHLERLPNRYSNFYEIALFISKEKLSECSYADDEALISLSDGLYFYPLHEIMKRVEIG